MSLKIDWKAINTDEASVVVQALRLKESKIKLRLGTSDSIGIPEETEGRALMKVKTWLE